MFPNRSLCLPSPLRRSCRLLLGVPSRVFIAARGGYYAYDMVDAPVVRHASIAEGGRRLYPAKARIRISDDRFLQEIQDNQKSSINITERGGFVNSERRLKNLNEKSSHAYILL
jgi:hypothetical protein